MDNLKYNGIHQQFLLVFLSSDIVYIYIVYIVYNCVYVFSVPMSFGDENKDIYIYIQPRITHKTQ
jgi:hypothetical protein